MACPRPPAGKIPDYARWFALLWLFIWVPAYWRTWGPANFVQLCDIAVLLTCIGFWTGSALLISSQAISSILIDLAWVLDAAWRFFSGHHLTGGTEYLFDPQYPLSVRLLSLYHVAMPLVLIWALLRLGYDRRGLPLQCAIVAFSFVAARFTSPLKNMDFAFTDPFIHRSWGPAPVHVTISILFMIFVVYYPTALLLQRFIPEKKSAP
jgi:hypothetical protein